MTYTEARLRAVHQFTQQAKRTTMGNAMCCDVFEEVPEPKHENMSVQIGNTWYKSYVVLEAIEHLRLSASMNALTRGEALLVHILQDNQLPL